MTRVNAGALAGEIAIVLGAWLLAGPKVAGGVLIAVGLLALLGELLSAKRGGS